MILGQKSTYRCLCPVLIKANAVIIVIIVTGLTSVLALKNCIVDPLFLINKQILILDGDQTERGKCGALVCQYCLLFAGCSLRFGLSVEVFFFIGQEKIYREDSLVGLGTYCKHIAKNHDSFATEVIVTCLRYLCPIRVPAEHSISVQ